MKSPTIALLCLIVCLAASVQAFSGIPGGLSPYPVKEVEKHLPLIEQHYNQQTNDDNYGLVAKIESAQSQVVAGQRLVVKYTLHVTDCKKQEVLQGQRAAKSCNKTKIVESCVADIYIRSWENYIDVSGMKCNDVKSGAYKQES